jgi:ABC-type transport system substrate-binding protein
MGTLIAGACSSTPSGGVAPSASATSAPKVGGTLTYAHQSEAPSPLNMLLSGTNTDFTVGMQIYESLYQQDETGNVQDWLAQSTAIAADGLTWTLKLRGGVKYHDGTAFDAASVKTNVDIRKAHPTFRGKSQIASIKEARVLDAQTVEFLLTKPAASLRAVLSSPLFGMHSPAALAKYADPVEYARNAAGTGPFKLDRLVNNLEIELVRNGDYWGEKAYLDRLIIRTVADNAARVASLESGDLHAIRSQGAAAEFERLKKEGKVDVLLSPVAITNVSMYFNTSKELMADKRVRQAITYATNREAYLGVTYGLGQMPDSIVVPGPYGYAGLTPYPFDRTKARALLAEAGVRAGTPLEILTADRSDYQEYAQLVKQDLDAIGFATTIRTVGTTAWIAEVGQSSADSKWQLGILGYGVPYQDAEAILDRFFNSVNDAPKGQNWTHYKNARVDTLLAQQAAATDIQQRLGLLREIQQIVWEDLPMSTLVFTKDAYAFRKNVRDFFSGSDGVIPRFHRTWLAQ